MLSRSINSIKKDEESLINLISDDEMEDKINIDNESHVSKSLYKDFVR